MWNIKMDLFRVYYDLYRIYGQNTFSAITFDWNKILTCSFFLLDSVGSGLSPRLHRSG